MTMVTTDSDGWKSFNSAVLRRSLISEHGLKDAFGLHMQYALAHNHMATLRNMKTFYDAMYAA
tara:strand:+ start:982 stop:1170 length:189 start_codon:yes stop_codon:yes gene_type:complete